MSGAAMFNVDLRASRKRLIELAPYDCEVPRRLRGSG